MTVSKRPIGDLVDKCETWNPKTSGAESFDYIDLNSVDKDTKSIASIERHECSEAPSRARQLIETGDVLVATVRPNLNGVALVNGAQHGMTASTGYCVLRPKEGELDSRYLFHWVKTSVFVQRMVDVATGANYPAVSDAKVKASTIPLPPLAEQKRIAGILDAADALRAKRRESLAQLDTLLQSTFLDMFGDPVTNPMGWEVVLLGEVASRVTKGESPKWQGFDYQDDGALFVTSENVRQGSIDISKPKFVPLDFNKKLKRSELRKGDLLINLVGASIGRSCLFPGFDRPANINQAVGVVTVGEGVEAKFLATLLTTSRGQELLLGNRVEAARANISLKNIRELCIPMPPVEGQRRFAAIVESVEQQKASQRAHLDELDTLFGSLQSRAFRGNL